MKKPKVTNTGAERHFEKNKEKVLNSVCIFKCLSIVRTTEFFNYKELLYSVEIKGYRLPRLSSQYRLLTIIPYCLHRYIINNIKACWPLNCTFILK